MSGTFCQVRQQKVNTLVIVGAVCRCTVCFVTPEYRGVLLVSTAAYAELLEIAHTFDLFTEHTFP